METKLTKKTIKDIDEARKEKDIPLNKVIKGFKSRKKVIDIL